MAILQLLTALASIAYLAHTSGPTSIYIIDVPEYSSLSSCAIESNQYKFCSTLISMIHHPKVSNSLC